MAIETQAQKDLLAKIAALSIKVEERVHLASEVRKQWNQLMVEAKDLRISSYKIAESAGLSQPRVIQIIKEAREEAATNEG
jgi:myo-inositol catabolism protein IolC